MGRYDFNLRKLRFSLILPAVQLPIALLLWELSRRLPSSWAPDIFSWPPAALICYGINAPAIFLKLAVIPFTRDRTSLPFPTIWGYGPEELAFFVGVVILWYFVGTLLDRRAVDKTHSESRTSVCITLKSIFVILLGVALGVALLVESVKGNAIPLGLDHWGSIVERILFLIWSIVLILISGLTLKNAIRRGFQR